MQLKNEKKYFTQWDKGQIVVIDDFPIETEIHFSNTKSKIAYVSKTDANHEVKVPDALLREPFPITIWVSTIDSDQHYTETRQEFQVIRRAMPEDYVIEPDEDDPTTIKQILITENGTVTENVREYVSAKITTNVSNSYTLEDEGKVVSNGALIPQVQDVITENGIFDTTLINQLLVEVAGDSFVKGEITVNERTLNLTINTGIVPNMFLLYDPSMQIIMPGYKAFTLILTNFTNQVWIGTNNSGLAGAAYSSSSTDYFSRSNTEVIITLSTGSGTYPGYIAPGTWKWIAW